MAERWQLHVTIETQRAFHTLGPGQTLPLIDRMLQVDPTGKPMIPASSVRGRVRVHLERLLKATKQAVCSPPRPEQTCPHDPAIRDRLADQSDPYCMACCIFGSVWRDSAVEFSNFYLAAETDPAAYTPAERIGVSINRSLNTAQAERLFTSQTTAPGAKLAFSGRVDGYLNRQELGWLLAGMRLVNYLGGEKARGLGRVKLAVADLRQWDPAGGQWQAVEATPLIEEVLKDA